MPPFKHIIIISNLITIIIITPLEYHKAQLNKQKKKKAREKK